MALLVVRPGRCFGFIVTVVFAATNLVQLAQGHPLCYVGGHEPGDGRIGDFLPQRGSGWVLLRRVRRGAAGEYARGIRRYRNLRRAI